MKILLLLVCFALAHARRLNNDLNCDGINVEGINHDRVVLKENLDKPYQLSIDYNTNILYFSYTLNLRETSFKMGYLNLKTNEFGTISGIDGPFASAVDEQSHNVYFGGADGIYKLKPNTNTATNIDVTNFNIWQVFYKDGIYFTTYPEEQAYLYKNDRVSRVTEIGESKAMLIALDKADNILYSNSTGLFLHTKDGKTEKMGDYVVNGFTTDIDGTIFFSTPTGMFKINDKTNEVKKIATKINIYGMAVESDGSIIYSEDDAIVRLKSTGQECFNYNSF